MGKREENREGIARGRVSSVASAFREYRDRILRRAERAPKRLCLHTVLFGSLNAFLLLINIVTGMSFPWFLFPLGGWAILLANHYTLCRQRQRQGREVNAVAELPGRETKTLKRLHRNRTAFTLTLTTSASVSLFLAMTNLLVSPQFPWAAITTGALGLVALFHYLGYSSRSRRLLEEISEGLPAEARLLFSASGKGRLAGGRTASALQPPEVATARRLKERITQHLSELPGNQSSLRTEIAPLLDRYVEQVILLARRRDELRGLTREAGSEEMAAERARLQERLDSSVSDSLKTEYRRALDQLDTRLESSRRLAERMEIADLRIASGINSLKQLEMDVVRMKSLSDFEESAAVRMLNAKSRELSEYLADLAKGRGELDDLE